jgi:c(7)-type cytochrome triheme protein
MKLMMKGGEIPMKKLLAAVLAVTVSFVMAATVFAVGPGKKIEFPDGAQGKVIFSGDVHKVNKCNDCHPDPFKMKKGTVKITKADHVPGKFCGKCHDGKKAFAQTEENCGKCHKK